MTDRGDADGLIVVCELIDDAVRAYTQRAQAVQPAAQRVSDVRVPFEKSKRVLDCIDDRPAEVEQLLSGDPREDDLGHASADSSTLAEVAAKMVEGDAVASCELGEASLDGDQRGGVRQDLGGLFERFVLVDRNDGGGRFSISSHEHVIAAVSNVA